MSKYKRGSQEDMHVCQELACTGQQLQDSAEESAEDEDEEEEEQQQCEEPNREELGPKDADLNKGGLHHDIRQAGEECCRNARIGISIEVLVLVITGTY
ncbi:MAG: hypothetical protein FRX49_08938 [Trebouxia sp. A1-2]|nr:MAG: hypothetical protein FRX49_08938 [Trebouxia sp. A1-2]